MNTKKRNRTILLLLFAVPLLAMVAVITGFSTVSNTVADRLEPLYFARGTQLSNQDAVKLEEELKSDPENFADRIELLAFFEFKLHREGMTPDERTQRRQYILWIIEHQPLSHFASSPEAAFNDMGADLEGSEQGKKLWLQQIQAHPGSSRILYNASRFFFWGHDMKKSEGLLEQAYAITPEDHDVASSLAGLYWTDARLLSDPEQVAGMAAKALKIFERALSDAANPRERFRDLPETAQAAFEAGNYERAATYAKEALTLSEQPDNLDNNADAIHYGNIVLGRIALKQGDVASASNHLLNAAKITGNPHLDTYGPNMMLAKELLEKGERKTVLQYFDSCGKFWKDDDGKLHQWHSAVLLGGTPDFGANLHY